MAFTPRLPTFHIPVVPWNFDPVTDTWTEGEEFVGQFYYARRDQAGTLLDSKFLVYPLESDVLIDPSEWNFDAHVDGPPYRCDAVQITQPSEGDATFYFVLSVEPRWLGFPNEHRVALLKRCTAEEASEITAGPPPEPPSSLLLEQSLGGPINNACGDCDALSGSHSLDLIDANPFNPVWRKDATCSCYSAGFLRLQVEYNRPLGIINVTATDTIASSTVAQWTLEIEDWDYSTSQLTTLTGDIDTQCTWTAYMQIDF